MVLFAAVTHAGWNAITHRIKDEPACLSLVGAGRTLCGADQACLAPLPAPAAWPYLTASVIVHIAYQVALMRSFRLGDFGQVYPIARGGAPLLVTLFAVLALGEHLNGASAAGVAIVMTGIAGLALWGVRDRTSRPSGPAVAMAATTGVMIAAYTVVDGVGVREAGAALGYTAWLMLLDRLAIPAYAAATQHAALAARLRPVLVPGLAGGVLSVLSYGLVLFARTRAPLAPVAVLREFSVIAAAAIAAFLFKERLGGPRIAAATLMATGIALMLSTT
ncbi:EamA family transporter [Streptomyces sp. RB110-1]|uniref:EamA family transporter n=1 Tax=unclassified Streptomyces TaxID=2593676 RepID=UPI0018FF7BF2|nr:MULTISPECIES: EamA family transporter [unclassified Streptomyces]MBK0372605.1 EamA family transporter [Streptomyces sp. RB110-1]MBK0372688.1 EamA family transporter [Streptomyces sp. RB110-1]MBK0384678.1 EamA family transporter [Streptomyces sp. RB110-2]MBK0390944.1 EamA family transporter [Streptomyces sp. RB110-2]